MRLSIAIDSSSQPVIGFAEYSDTGLKLLSSVELDAKNSAESLLSVIVSELDKFEVSFKDIDKLIVGLGPGSFTGLRVACSLAEGLDFCNSKSAKKTVGISSASAFPASVNLLNDSAVLYDGRQSEILLYKIDFKNQKYKLNREPVILNASEKMPEHLKEKALFSVSRNYKLVNDVLGGEIAEKTKFFDKFPVEGLFKAENCTEHHSISDPVYMRPAVFVKKRRIRKDL